MEQSSPRVLEYRNARADPPKPRTNELLLLMLACISVCLPPLSIGLSMLSIISGVQVLRARPPVEVSGAWAMVIGGGVLLAGWTALIVWMLAS